SIVTGCVICGRLAGGLIVQTCDVALQPASFAGISKLIVLASLFAFAALIASRREQWLGKQKPLSTLSVVLTVSVVGGASSRVIVPVPSGSLMVAPLAFERGTVKVSFAS